MSQTLPRDSLFRRQATRNLTILVLLVFNISAIALLVWSRDGGRVVIELDGASGLQRLTSDGKQVIPRDDSGRTHASLDAPESGTLMLVLPLEVSSLPHPSGIDRVLIRSATGAVLLQDDFDDLDPARWEVVEGEFEIDDGVLTSDHFGRNELRLRGPGFSNYDVIVTYRNSRGGVVGTHVQGSDGIFWHLELIRDFPNFVDVFKDGQRTGIEFGTLMRSSNEGPVASIARMVTQPYPYIVLWLTTGVLLTILLSQLRVGEIALTRLSKRATERLPLTSIAVVGLAIAAFGLTLTINGRYYGSIPHVPDEVAYIFQANLLADFKVTGLIPPVRDAFQFYSPSFLVENGDHWASFYPFGHPLVLALGAFFNAVKVVPSLVGAFTVVMIFLTGRRIYDSWTGLVAAAFLAASPFFLLQSSNFMSHNTAAFFVISSFFFLTNRERPLLYGLLAGLAFGLGVNTRPLTMAALVIPFGIVMLLPLINKSDKTTPWVKHTVAFLGGVGLMLLAMLAYNQAITGDAFTSTYSLAQGGTEELFGFRNGHYLDIGLRNEQAQTMALLLVFNAWPSFVGLAFAMAPFLLGSRNRWDYALLGCTLLPMAIYVGYRFSGVYGGPRYWFEVMPFLVLLSARGTVVSSQRLVDLGRWVAAKVPRGRPPANWAGRVVTYTTVAVLIVYGTGGWLTGLARDQYSPLVPTEAKAIEGLFGVDDRLNRLADQADLKDALVLVEPCGFYGSYVCYGSVFLRNLPDFNGDVVWALYREETNQAVIEAFPGRQVYVASWENGGSLREYEAR